VRSIFPLFLLVMLLLAACATYQPPPPNLYIAGLPQAVVAELSLDDRIATEDAWANLKRGDGNKARKTLAKLDETSPFYYVGMGYAYFIMRDFDLAEDFFKAALRFSPEMSVTHAGLAQIYMRKGQEDLALSELREVLKLEPDHPWANPEYSKLKDRLTRNALREGEAQLQEGNTEESKAAYLKALFYSPESTDAHLALADIFLAEDNLESALVHLEGAYRGRPEDETILEKYGDALFRANQNKEALEIYERLAERRPDNQEFKQRLEVLKNRLGIFELPSQYNAILSSEAVSKEEMAALLAVKFKDILEAPPQKPPIIIDIATSWAAEYILEAASLELMDIYPNHTFRPKKIITRAEMAEILMRLVNHLEDKGYRFIQQIPPQQIEISDVSPDNYYYQPILEIISYDIMGLSLDKKFNPDLPVSGSEAIKLLDIVLRLIS